MRLLRDAGAVHLAGDQHIAMLIEYGVDRHRDSGRSFAVSASRNSINSRWWGPEGDTLGARRNPDEVLPWTGDYLDGFGNKITMHAYANPDNQSYGAGYALIRFNKPIGEATFEGRPRDANVSETGARQFPGWPRTVTVTH